ncbi:histidine kinase [Solibacillus sp. FSL H8-0523]|uniref:sensor histidine kinase n=1 Tax=Solibacillus sp. FSL H8-0523 TaxID=2954511 RepID=UPI003100E7EF
MIFSTLLPLFLILTFSYEYQKQFTPAPLQDGVVHLPNEEDALVQLNHGWTYDVGTRIQLVEATPFTVHTNKVTTFSLKLQVPKAQQIYSVKLAGIHQPFELWVNGQLIKAGSRQAQEKLTHFYVDRSSVDLKLVITPINDRIAFLQTPIFGQTDTMQGFFIKNLIIMLLTLISLTILGVYSITLYFSKEHKILHLQIGIYFLLVSGSLLLSNEGIVAVFLNFSDSLVKLKTIAGILAAVPLYFIVAAINQVVLSKVKISRFLSIIVLVLFLILIAPLEIYRPLEIIIWGCLIGILFLHLLKLIIYFAKNKQFKLKNILLLNTLFYLLLYLILRIYYNVWGTDFQSNLLLIIFAISICLYLMLYQNQLVSELERSKKEAIQSKISFFNAQIKPHFIYNALSNIMALCYTDNLKAAHLLGKFSTYLRLIFENNTQNDWISLEKELTLIDAYVEIEKARFPDKIHYTLEVDPMSKSLTIPALSIQPFVENAIRHGLFNKEGTGIVSVKTKQQPHELIITIKDDGVGMTPETVATILEGTQEQQGIGVLNVIQRLQYIDNSQFDLHSALHEGTTIVLKIPIQS